MFIVTGASSGIGKATAQALAQRSQNVVAVARNLSGLVRLQKVAPKRIKPVGSDLSTASGIEAALESVANQPRIPGMRTAPASPLS